MRLREILRLSLSSIRQNRVRAILTTLGVAIGVAALVGMVAVGAGIQDNLSNRMLASTAARAITVMPSGGDRPRRGAPRASGSVVVDDAALARIRRLPAVSRVERDLRVPVEVQSGTERAREVAVGLTTESRDERLFKDLAAGRYFGSESAREVILQRSVAEDLGFKDPQGLIGKTVRVTLGGGATAAGPLGQLAAGMLAPATLELEVVGLTTGELRTSGMARTSVFLPYGVIKSELDRLAARAPMLRRLLRGGTATAYVRSARDLEETGRAIERLGFRTFSLATALSELRRVFLVIDSLLALAGSIGLLVASLGIANTMLMAVLERTREIGILKALGAEDADVWKLFLAESMVFGFVGGWVGLGLAWIVGRGMNAIANVYFVRNGGQPENLLRFPIWLVVGAVGFAVLVSVLAGQYPARKAARMEPARALRHE